MAQKGFEKETSPFNKGRCSMQEQTLEKMEQVLFLLLKVSETIKAG